MVDVPDYSEWRGNDSSIIHVPYEYKSQLWIEQKLWDPVLVHSLFNTYWFWSVYLAIGYVVAVFTLDRWMQSRKPYDLKGTLALWNGCLAFFSIVATWRFGEEFIHVVLNRPFRHSVCYSVDPTGPAAFWACCFALSKVAELGDTVFLVLRKRPLIFLHWYHHAVVLVYSWNSACELTAAGRWFIFMNYFVHSIMYSYYAITSLGYRFPKAASASVTTLQLTQMIVGVGISVFVLREKLVNAACQQSMDNLFLCFGIYASFALLFLKFFLDAYVFKKKKKVD
ncbi:hypothetical protein QR680_000064 [Steinernema hermaphroditum]|uniref:Elongation of very long chain fatty acids protein n=1 Tax=Steinernema hermaphroditum TaxID=289476 RepID=A0AA39GTX8_9BILA|nr:hypothetical protein QR680_000064 [Steinernema hermaphroditum]